MGYTALHKLGSIQPTPKKRYFKIGLDIGGTSIKPVVMEVIDGVMKKEPFWQPVISTEEDKEKYKTVKGLEAHKRFIAELIAEAYTKIQEVNGELLGVGIGSPGRFDVETGKIKPGTNTNLGKRTDEFDGKFLIEEYQQALQVLAKEQNRPELAEITIKVDNDAGVMHKGILEEIVGDSESKLELKDQHDQPVNKFSLYDQYVGLFGIGTGIGHAIAKFGADGSYKFVTDGHASKLLLKVDPEDLGLLEAAKKIAEQRTFEKEGVHKEEVIFQDGMVRSEDLFRDPIVTAMASVGGDDIRNGKDINLNNDAHRRAVHFAGKYMARLIDDIKRGKKIDMVPDNGWSETEKAEAAQTSIYMIAGGLGGSSVGKEMINFASAELKTLGIDKDVKLVHYTGENVAARSAAMLVPNLPELGLAIGAKAA